MPDDFDSYCAACEKERAALIRSFSERGTPPSVADGAMAAILAGNIVDCAGDLADLLEGIKATANDIANMAVEAFNLRKAEEARRARRQ